MLWLTVAINPMPMRTFIISLALIPMRFARSDRTMASSILMRRLMALAVVIWVFWVCDGGLGLGAFARLTRPVALIIEVLAFNDRFFPERYLLF